MSQTFRNEMLCAIQKTSGKSVIASPAVVNSAPFLCPDCKEEVVLKLGTVRTNHFAHKGPGDCHFSVGETDAHRKCKMEIYKALLNEPGVTKVALERSLKTARPDISAYIHGVPVAIEVQISSLSLKTIIRRTEEYTRKGIYVLWLLQWTPYLDGIRYRPRLWEKWIHRAYGHVYYWMKDVTVAAYYFQDYFRFAGPQFSIRVSSRDSRVNNPLNSRYKTPVQVKLLNLSRDFMPQLRSQCLGRELFIPKSLLLTHRIEYK